MLCTKNISKFLLILFSVLNYQIFPTDKIDEGLNERSIEIENSSLLLQYDFQRFSDQTVASPIKNPETNNYKSPWLAFGLSLFLPGMGQIYNGDYTKGVIQMLLVLGGGGLVVSTACTECGEAGDLQTAAFITGLGLASVGYIWSILDAPMSANSHNQQSKNLGLTLYSNKNSAIFYNFKSYQNTDFHRISLKIDFK